MTNLRATLLIFSILVALNPSTLLAAKAVKKNAPKPSMAFVERRLTREGFSKSFIQEVTTAYEPKDFADVIELNVLLFLRKSDYHAVQVTPEAEREVNKFMIDNKDAFDKAEAASHVPASVVASLLWIESRYGRNTGNFHVPSVYLDLIQTTRMSVQNYLMSRAWKFSEKKVTKAQRKEIVARTHRKADWALAELRSLEQAYQRDWSMGKDFRGSFSGAFGMPQFLPSSYVRWARSINPPAQPLLLNADDAVLSVAYYLSSHGWKTEKEESQMKALMLYNNSRDYANAILNLAGKLEPRAVSTAAKSKGPAPAAETARK